MPQKGTEKRRSSENVISTESALLWIHCREIAPFETPTFSKNVGELIARATSVPQKRTGPRWRLRPADRSADPRHWRAHPSDRRATGQVRFASVASHIASETSPLACRGQRDIHTTNGGTRAMSR
jgi:hypothetical protein